MRGPSVIPVMIPVLHTGRLILDAPQIADFPAYAGLVTGPRAAFMGGPHSLATAWGWFCSDVAGWMLLGFGGLIMRRRSDGRAVGQVALSRGPDLPETQLGWMIFSEADEGRGYAAEGAAALRDWAFGPGGLATCVAYIKGANRRSIRLAERLGARADDRARLPAGMDTLVWRFGVSS